ncbi:MAG: Ig-like domain-containing protein [Spirochaetes bacterium]|nr:Ig-like domain-containing protein [Spirochaetota bacterium]
MRVKHFMYILCISAAAAIALFGCSSGGDIVTTGEGVEGGKDFSAPSITSVLPADGDTDVPLNANLVIFFDEAVHAGTGYVNIYDSGGLLFEAIDVTSTGVTAIGDRAFLMDTSSVFAVSESYYVLIDAGAFMDASDNMHVGITDTASWDFQAGASTNLAGPVIADLFPEDEQTDVALNANLVVTFDEAVIAGTGNVNIYDSTDSLFETIDVNSGLVAGLGTDTVEINPTGDFVIATGYYVQIDAGAFRDTANNDHAGIVPPDTSTWNFISGTEPDSEPPSVTGLSPQDDETTALPTANLVIGFDEAVIDGEGMITVYGPGDSLFEAIDVGSASVTGFGTDTITVDPAEDFIELESYYVLIDPGAFKDSANHDFAGLTDSSSWNFTVRDNTPPTIEKVYPYDGSAALPLNANLIIVFTEAVEAGSGYVTVYDSASPVETIDVAGGRVSGFGTDTILIDSALSLTASDTHYVQIDEGAFVDASPSANPFAGIGDAVTWNFTTGEAADSTAPQISGRTPPPGEIMVPLNTSLEIAFDEPVFVDSGYIRIYESGYGEREQIDVTSGPVAGAWTDTIRIDTTGFPTAMMFYWVTIDQTAFYDISGNYFAGIDNASWNFMTGDSADSTPPAVTALHPADDSTNVTLDTALEMEFTETVYAGGGYIGIYDETDTLLEKIDAGSAQVTGLGTDTVTITPSSDLDGLTGHYILIGETAFKDSANNFFEGISDTATWSFATERGDMLGGYESFGYGATGGDLDTYALGSWIEIADPAPASKVQYVASGGYVWPGYSESGAAGRVTAQNDAAQSSIMKTDLLSAADRNAVYLSFIVDGIVTVDGSEGFGVGFYDSTAAGRLGGVFFAGGPQTGGSRYSIRLSDGTQSVQIMTNKKGTHLVVVKYDFSTGVLSGYVDPDTSLGVPTPDGSITVSSPWESVDSIVLDESWQSGTGDCTYGIDEMKVTKSWSLLSE